MASTLLVLALVVPPARAATRIAAYCTRTGGYRWRASSNEVHEGVHLESRDARRSADSGRRLVPDWYPLAADEDRYDGETPAFAGALFR